MGTLICVNPGISLILGPPWNWMTGISIGHDVVQLNPFLVPFMPIDAAVEMLDDALHNVSYAKPLIPYGHSIAGQAIYKWLRDFGPDSDIDPADVDFIVSGCPERKYNGVGVYTKWTSWYGGPGIPEDTAYTGTDFTRQYDFYSDYPNNPSNFQAWSNAFSGIDALGHMKYYGISHLSPDAAEYVDEDNGWTYSIYSNYPMPAVAGMAWFPGWAESQDRQLRPIVESAYDRPIDPPIVGLPPITPGISPTLDFNYRTPDVSPMRRKGKYEIW